MTGIPQRVFAGRPPCVFSRPLVGSPQQIIDKLIYERELFAPDRFLGQVGISGLP
jgi:hypothetical protein